MSVLDPSLKDPNLGEETRDVNEDEETRDVNEDEETKDTDGMDVEVESGTPSVPSSCPPVALQKAPSPPSFLEQS